jgi:type IV secretion system protein VirB11
VPAGTVSLTFRRHSKEVAPGEAIPSRYDTSRWNRWEGRREAQKNRYAAILEAYDAGDVVRFLKEAALLRFNALMVGKVGSGKTSFLNTFLTFIRPAERIITIENAFELILPNQPNNVRLLYSHGDQGTAKVSQGDLLAACLRMRGDRVLVGEIRDPSAAYTYAEEAVTGHRGSATTIHGGNAAEGVQRLFHLIKGSEAGRHSDEPTVIQKISQAVDVVVPFEEFEGRHAIGEVWLKPDAERRGKTIAELLS